jgi:hypothetical protein
MRLCWDRPCSVESSGRPSPNNNGIRTPAGMERNVVPVPRWSMTCRACGAAAQSTRRRLNISGARQGRSVTITAMLSMGNRVRITSMAASRDSLRSSHGSGRVSTSTSRARRFTSRSSERRTPVGGVKQLSTTVMVRSNRPSATANRSVVETSSRVLGQVERVYWQK